jgi:hypothetical protein
MADVKPNVKDIKPGVKAEGELPSGKIQVQVDFNGQGM